MSFKNNLIKLTENFGGPYFLVKKGIKRGLITSILQGSDTGLSNVFMIANALEVPIGLLIGEDKKSNADKIREPREIYGIQAIEEHQLIVHYRGLLPEERSFIIKLIEIFKGTNEQDKVAVKYNIDSFHRNKNTATRVEADYVKDARTVLKKTETGNAK